ncbi:MAG: ABC transporter ATP-binding protein [Anaerovoracaceae bacterium]
MDKNLLLEVKDLNVYYGGIQALNNVSLELKRGEILSIIGANGAGKSTLLRTIAGDKEIGTGEIIFNGKPIPKTVHDVVGEGISLVPEGRRIFPNLSVKDNLKIGAYRRKDKDGIEEDLEDVLLLFPRLKERYHQMGGTLSGGEQQMLAVGRALMSRPTLLCFDEPSLGLAPIVIDELFEKIKKINREKGQTILLVEQNVYLALDVSDRAYILNTGRITYEGKSSEMIDDPFIQKEYMGIK